MLGQRLAERGHDAGDCHTGFSSAAADAGSRRESGPCLSARASPGQADAAEAPAPLTEAAERASDKLRVHLSKRIGQEGFRVLLARALSLTTTVFPHLSAVRVGADGALVGLRGALDRSSQEARDNGTQKSGTRDDRTQEDTAEAATALIGQFLGLLIVFIGEDLTLRMLGAVWPGLASRDASGLGSDASGRETEGP